MNVESEFCFAEFAFAPVPAAEGVFFAFEVDTVEEFEGFGYAVEVLEM